MLKFRCCCGKLRALGSETEIGSEFGELRTDNGNLIEIVEQWQNTEEWKMLDNLGASLYRLIERASCGFAIY
jgi:hypothetical protein